MKKLIIVAAMAAFSTLAQASLAGKMCARIAELAVDVAGASRAGVAWQEIENIHNKNFSEKSAVNEVVLSVTRETYYSWASFDNKNVRQLAYTYCMIEMPGAVRK